MSPRFMNLTAVLIVTAVTVGLASSNMRATFSSDARANAARVVEQAKSKADGLESAIIDDVAKVTDAFARAKSELKDKADLAIKIIEQPHGQYLEPIRPAHGFAEGIVHTSQEEVWEILTNFADLSWWPIYTKIKDLSGHSNVGAKRLLEFPRTKLGSDEKYTQQTVEELFTKDKSTWTFQYKILSATPEIPFADLSSLVMTVVLAPVEGDPGSTHITWSSTTYGVMNLVPLVAKAQSDAYANGIAALRSKFSQQVGVVHVRSTSVKLPDLVVAESALAGKVNITVSLQVTIGYSFNETAQTMLDPSTGVASFTGEELQIPLDESDKEIVFTVFEIDAEEKRKLRGVATVKLDAAQGVEGSAENLNYLPVKRALEGSFSGTLDASYAIRFLPGEKRIFTAPTSSETLLDVFTYFSAKVTEVIGKSLDVSTGPYDYAEYPAPMDKVLPKMMDGIVRDEVVTPTKISDVGTTVIHYVYNVVNAFVMKSPFLNDQWLAYFGDVFPAPKHVASHWMDDTEFARNYISGENPFEIQVLRDLGKLPTGFIDLKPGGETVQSLFDQRRLFFAEYPLMDWDIIPLHLQDMVHYAPFVLLFNEQAKGGMRLNVAGIKLEPKKADARVYYPGDGFPKRWLFAKMHAMLADHSYHQFVRHLGWGHLYSEPLAIAQHNAFWDFPDHPIGQLLKVHYEGTIGINYLARQTLVDEEYAFTGETFSVGAHGGLRMAGLWLSQQSLLDLTHPRYLEARGFDEAGSDGIEEFWFRDDGYKMWHLFEEYVTEIVDTTYASDVAVRFDPALVKYYDELSNPEKANVKGVAKRPSTKKDLVQVILAAIWPSSIVHSVVNYSQKEYSSYVPFRPISLRLLMPEWSETKDLTDEYLQRALPSVPVAHFQVLFAYLLGDTPSHSYLTTLKDIYTKDENNEILKDFQGKLGQLSEHIRSRNKNLEAQGKATYPWLDPTQVAASANI